MIVHHLINLPVFVRLFFSFYQKKSGFQISIEIDLWNPDQKLLSTTLGPWDYLFLLPAVHFVSEHYFFADLQPAVALFEARDSDLESQQVWNSDGRSGFAEPVDGSADLAG